MIDTLHWCLAFGPVAIYLVLLGGVNLFRRPFLVSGTRDTAALGLALSGLFTAGPIELFFPLAASIRFGPYIWGLLIVLYVLCLVLVLLVMAPRLVIYNISPDALRPILADVVTALDPEARWAGDSLVIPSLGVQFYVDSSVAMRNVSLVSAGRQQNPQGWARLQQALAPVLAELEVPRNRCGMALLVAGAVIGLVLMLAVARNPHAVAQSLLEMLRLE